MTSDRAICILNRYMWFSCYINNVLSDTGHSQRCLIKAVVKVDEKGFSLAAVAFHWGLVRSVKAATVQSNVEMKALQIWQLQYSDRYRFYRCLSLNTRRWGPRMWRQVVNVSQDEYIMFDNMILSRSENVYENSSATDKITTTTKKISISAGICVVAIWYTPKSN